MLENAFEYLLTGRMPKGGQNPEKISRWRMCGKALFAALCGLKAQQVHSPGQRPGYSSPRPAPCKGKSKSQSFVHTFALTGRRGLYTDTQSVALGLWTGCPFRAFLFALCSFMMCACFVACYLVKNRAEIFLDFEYLSVCPLQSYKKAVSYGGNFEGFFRRCGVCYCDAAGRASRR